MPTVDSVEAEINSAIQIFMKAETNYETDNNSNCYHETRKIEEKLSENTLLSKICYALGIVGS